MDFDRIKLLLDIFHGTKDLPGTERIRAEALEELKEYNSQDMSVETEGA